MDGLTAMQAIREIDQDIPIIVVSHTLTNRTNKQLTRAGAPETVGRKGLYIMKPVDAKKLTSTISLLLSIKEHHISIH